MGKIIGMIMLVLIARQAEADFKLIELDEIRADYMQYFPKGRDPLITHNGLQDRQLGQLLDVQIQTTIAKYGYWRTLVHSYTDSIASTGANGQFRSVGLNMEIGVRIAPMIDVFYYHYSQHLLDTPDTNLGGFPVQDGVGFHLYIYSKDRKDSLL